MLLQLMAVISQHTTLQDHLDPAVGFTATAEQLLKPGQRSCMAILSGLLLHRPLKMRRCTIKHISGNNGFEVWRQLTGVFTRRRHGANPWAAATFRCRCGRLVVKNVADDLMLTLVRCLPDSESHSAQYV